MQFTVITLFPKIVEAFVSEGLIATAKANARVRVDTLNPRQFTEDVHQTVDDRVFGGADGMAMKVEPLARAVRSLGEVDRVVVLTPQGRPWAQSEARAWAERGGHVALVCGRYAGIDHRFTVLHADDEISLGDFVLNGGEVAACAVIESVVRLIPGVLGNARSSVRDSFAEDGLLECPQFTRPREIEGLPVPAPLLSGHHARIAEFERAVARVRTALLRPDILSPAEVAADAESVATLSDPELTALGLTREDLESLK